MSYKSVLINLLSCFLSIFLFNCYGNNTEEGLKVISKTPNYNVVELSDSLILKLKDSTYRVPWKNSNVDVICKPSLTDTVKGVILLLPGWNFNTDEWCTKMDFCQRARNLGYHLVMPQMYKSMYAEHYYSETRTDFMKFPTRKWITDTMLPYFQKQFGMFMQGKNNYICGISTGGRGSVLIALDLPEVFKKGVALSGDFNPLKMKNDNLLNKYYGSFAAFPERWKNNDNAFLRISELKMPFLFLHGKDDRVVPCSQSEDYYNESKSKNMTNIELKIVSGAGHNYKFWNSQTDFVLSFFERK
jgi:pimeloyl-ACP methyl ester carboxylesterase